MKKIKHQMILNVTILTFVLITSGYGIIQFCRTYCSWLFDKLDEFLNKDSNLEIYLVTIIMIILFLIAEIVYSKLTKN
jgi:hypothetical protein